MALLAKAPTQEEQIEYVAALRMLKTGWTPELRKEYFTWFPKAADFKGGDSLGGFIRSIKNDAVATLTPDGEGRAEADPRGQPTEPTARSRPGPAAVRQGRGSSTSWSRSSRRA